jgi:hypothetical protein
MDCHDCTDGYCACFSGLDPDDANNDAPSPPAP